MVLLRNIQNWSVFYDNRVRKGFLNSSPGCWYLLLLCSSLSDGVSERSVHRETLSLFLLAYLPLFSRSRYVFRSDQIHDADGAGLVHRGTERRRWRRAAETLLFVPPRWLELLRCFQIDGGGRGVRLRVRYRVRRPVRQRQGHRNLQRVRVNPFAFIRLIFLFTFSILCYIFSMGGFDGLQEEDSHKWTIPFWCDCLFTAV